MKKIFISVKRFFLFILEKIIIVDRISQKHPISVKGIIVHNEKIILLKNSKGEWDLPGGKISSGENLEECLKREVKEELNLTIKPKNLLQASFIKVMEKVNVFVVIVLCELIEDISNIEISFEHTEVKLFSINEVKNLNMPNLYKEIIRQINP